MTNHRSDFIDGFVSVNHRIEGIAGGLQATGVGNNVCYHYIGCFLVVANV